MNTYQVVTADQLDASALKAFLDRVYPPAKSRFLQVHGAWWHRGNENRWAITDGGMVVAYCAIIPTRCLLDGQAEPTLWWVDLIVLPEYRGQGLQRLFDEKVRHAADLKLGFPNELAAKIHLKHGWGVRDDLRYMVLPLAPRALKRVRTSRGLQGTLLRTAAAAATPFASLLRGALGRYNPVSARRVDQPDAHVLANVFIRHNANAPVVTTYRDADYIKWRFLDSPYRSEMAFYLCGPEQIPTHALITRSFATPGGRTTRILDVFGDLSDRAGLRDVIRLTVRDAVRSGATEMTAIASLPALVSTLRASGFMLSARARFCWHSASDSKMSLLSERPGHWVMADSDSDDPPADAA